MDVGSTGRLVCSPAQRSISLRDIVCENRSGGVERIHGIDDTVHGLGELHLACDLQAHGAPPVIVPELNQAGTWSDLDRLAVIERNAGAGLHLGPGLRPYGGGATDGVVRVGFADLHLAHVPVPGADFGEPLGEPGRVCVEA